MFVRGKKRMRVRKNNSGLSGASAQSFQVKTSVQAVQLKVTELLKNTDRGNTGEEKRSGTEPGKIAGSRLLCR